MSKTFADLGVPAELVAVLDKQGITAPFEVQEASIPDALKGRDVLGRAPTGSGKTLAFGLPLITKLGRATPRNPRALILSPTRELAEQIRRELEPLAKASNRSVLAVYGGVGFGNQLDALKRGVDILVACPGRLLDLIDRGEVSLKKVDYVVVDEADRMCDMGFLPSLRKLLDMTSPDRQTVLFSATLDKDVKVITDKYQTNPVLHEVGEVEPDLSTMTHHFVAIDHGGKIELSADVIANAGPTVVFCRTRHGVDRVARQLKAAGIKAGWIHGGRSQSQRDRALAAFTDQQVLALVATDVAARGIHVDGVACVIHFDPPEDGKTYVHRSGRTARAGAAGQVVSLVKNEERKAIRSIQKETDLPADVETIEAFRTHTPERDPLLWPKPKRQANNQRSGGGKGKNGSKGGAKKRNNAAGSKKPASQQGKVRTDNKDDASWETTSVNPRRRGGGGPSGGKRGSGASNPSARSGRARSKNKGSRSGPHSG